MDNSENTLDKSLLNSDQTKASKSEIVAANPRKQRKIKLYNKSVLIDAYVIFLTASSIGLLMCGLWPLCNALGGNKIHLGTHAVCGNIVIFILYSCIYFFSI